MDYTARLRSRLQQVNLPSFKALGRAAAVSDWQIEQLRQGKIARMRVETLLKLSQALQMTLPELLDEFSDSSESNRSPLAPLKKGGEQAATGKSLSSEETSLDSEVPLSKGDLGGSNDLGRSNIDALQQEYQRLQAQLEQQQATLQKEFQQATLQILESWLTQFPTLIHAAQQNAEVPVGKVNLMAFMRPVERLIQTWGIESIAPIGSEVHYDPQYHQLMQGTAKPGEPVKVRYAGYRQGEKLLYRAKVSPVTS